MSCCNCNCSPCSCTVNERRLVAPQVSIRHFNDGNCCPIKGWYETLAIPSWTPPAAGETTTVAVCDATQFPVGMCAVITDGTSKRVVKVVGWNNDQNAIYIKGYENAEAVGGSMSGVINIAPVALCPVETQSGGVVCNRDWMKTAEAFVVPTAQTSGGGTVKIVFDKPQTLQLGMVIYVVGAGYMEIGAPPSGTFVECGTEFYAYNLGSVNNAGAGTNIAAGAAAYPDPVPAGNEAGSTEGAANYVYGANGTTRVITATGSDTDLLITLTGVVTDDLIEIWGEANVGSPRMQLGFTVAGTSSPALIAGIPCSTYDGDGQTHMPYVHHHRKVVMKATADGTLTAKWAWTPLNGYCTGNLYERNLFARVIGTDP